MFGRRGSTRPADPAVSAIEEMLGRAGVRHPAGEWQGRARHVLWICACVTEDHFPDWMIFDTDDGVGWRRWPDHPPDAEVVHAPLEAGGHAAPSEVLAWLQGAADDPWGAGGDGSGDPEVLVALQRRIAEA